MTLSSLSIRDFRNHRKSDIEWSPGHNILVGKNGQGKTNVLEAVSYLCLGRSFYGSGDALILNHESEQFSLRGALESERGVVFSVDVVYISEPGSRKVRVGGSELARRSDLVGMFPVVVLSPEHAPITSGGPGERRRMVDTTLAQAHRSYLEDAVEYRKALRQRNKLLLDGKLTRRLDEDALEPWTDMLIERGSRITDRRRKFAQEFQPFITEAVTELSAAAEVPSMEYRPSIGSSGGEGTTKEVFRDQLQAVRRDEARAGTTLAGPHRDEFEFQINGLSVRHYASQGQHKTMLVGLKFAEFNFLKEACQETPLLLLDDVLSELDQERNERVFHLTSRAGQVFITAADQRLLPGDPGEGNLCLSVEAGEVRRRQYANA